MYIAELSVLRLRIDVGVCLPGCETWTRQEGVVSPGAKWHPLTSVADCQTRCLQMSTCVAVDVSSSICAVHTNASDLSVKFSAVGFTQYTLNLACRSPPPRTGKLHRVNFQLLEHSKPWLLVQNVTSLL